MSVSSVGRPSEVSVVFGSTKSFTLGKNPMSVNCVARPSDIIVYFECMKGPTLAKSLMLVNSVVKPSKVSVTFEYMKKLIVVSTDVISVAKPSVLPIPSGRTKEHTVETERMSVKSVTKPLDASVIFRYMRKLMLKENPTDVNNAASPSFTSIYLKSTRRLIAQKSPINV